jgi:sugar phosphate permease
LNKARNKTNNYRWLIWGIMALSYIVVFFHRMAAGVVQDNLVESFHISATTFANLGATYFYAYMLMQIPAGILADTLGARKTVTAGTLLAGVGSILFGFAPTVAVAFLGRLLVGMGVSVVFVCILKILSVWFRPEEFSTMSGITSFIGNMGGLLAQTPLALMVAVFTWRNTFMAIGLASILIAVLCYLIIRDYPADMQPQDNSAVSQRKKAPKPSAKTFLQVITNKHTWPGFFLFAGFFGAYIAFSGTWGVSYMMDVYGLSKSNAANYPMAATLGLMVGSILIGVISDRSKSRKKPMIVFGLCYLATWAILVFSNGGKPPIEILYPLLFAMGFFCATFILTFAVAKEVNNPETAGVSTATVNTGGFLGAALLPALMGMYLDSAGTLPAVTLYQNAFMYCLIAAVIATISIFLIKETGCRNIWHNPDTK